MTTLHSERRGQGRPLLMVHGLGGSIRSWDPIVPALSQQRELILVDMPGHGQSAAIGGRQTIAAYADVLTQFIDAHNLGAVDLAGSSVGARLVLELARRGVGGNCVAFDPGGFWRGWETQFFRITIAASIRLVRLLQPMMPFLSRHAATRTMLLLQLSAKPWALAPGTVLTEMRTFAATPVFDQIVRELAHGPLQEGAAVRLAASRSAGAAMTGCCCPVRPAAHNRHFPTRGCIGLTIAAIFHNGISRRKRYA